MEKTRSADHQTGFADLTPGKRRHQFFNFTASALNLPAVAACR